MLIYAKPCFSFSAKPEKVFIKGGNLATSKTFTSFILFKSKKDK